MIKKNPYSDQLSCACDNNNNKKKIIFPFLIRAMLCVDSK